MAAQDIVKDGPCTLLAKKETTKGTDATPVVGSDGVFAKNVKIQPKFQEVDRERVRNGYPSPGVIIAKAWFEWEVQLPLAGPKDPGVGAADEPESLRYLWNGCWPFSSGGVPVDTHTIAQSSLTQQDGLSQYMYWFSDDGTVELDKLIGSVCNSMKLTLPKDSEGFWTFGGKAKYAPPTNPADPGGADYTHEGDETAPRGHTLTVDGRTDDIDSVEIDWAHDLCQIDSHDETYGIFGWYLRLKPPTIKVNPTRVVTSTYDVQAAILAHTLGVVALQLNTIGGARYTVNAAECQQGDMSWESIGGIWRRMQTLHPRDTVGGGGDDAMNIVVTYP